MLMKTYCILFLYSPVLKSAKINRRKNVNDDKNAKIAKKSCLTIHYFSQWGSSYEFQQSPTMTLTASTSTLFCCISRFTFLSSSRCLSTVSFNFVSTSISFSSVSAQINKYYYIKPMQYTWTESVILTAVKIDILSDDKLWYSSIYAKNMNCGYSLELAGPVSAVDSVSSLAFENSQFYSWVQQTFFYWDRSWNIFYCYSPPTTVRFKKGSYQLLVKGCAE